MATSVEISLSETDLANADAFLTSWLSSRIVDADFSPGSAIRDFVVKAISCVFAYLEQERQRAKDYSSLLSLSKLPPSAEVDAAVDAFLSSLFLTRKTGQPTHLPCLLHFSAPVDVILTPSIRFFRTADLVFTPDVSSTVVIPVSSLRLTTSTDGAQDYVCAVNLVAATKDPAYNVEPGRFVQVDRFNPYFTYAENAEAGVDGKGPETTADLLARAPTALSTRNLVNPRSVSQVLFENFPTLSRALAVGMGEPEMLRDLVTETVTGLRLHAGGHTDIYLGLPRVEVTEEGLVAGAKFPRADGRISILRDAALGDHAFDGVSIGNVLAVLSGVLGTPRTSVVVRATPSELEVATPFPAATDEVGGTVQYTVGSVGPSFRNLIGSDAPRSSGVTSRSERQPGSVYLQGQPVYRVKTVAYQGDQAMVEIPDRVNGPPAAPAEYQVEVLNPASAQSQRAVTRLRLHDSLDGVTVRVTYDSLVGFEAVDTFVTGPFDRILAANHLVRGYNPAYVGAEIAYTRRFGAKVRYDQSVLAQAVSDFVNDFDWTNVLDVSSISTALKTGFPDIAVVFPFTFRYAFFAPDGEVLRYESQDIATLFPSEENTATLLNGDQLRSPLAPSSVSALSSLLAQLGVSDRTVRYVSDTSDIYVWERDVDPPPSSRAG